MQQDQGSKNQIAPQNWRFPDRIAYVVNHSLPYSSNGYAVRTHEVARALGALGHEILVINRPGRPWDIEGFPAQTTVAPSQTIDGVRYLFLPLNITDRGTGLRARLRQAEKTLLEAFEVFRPSAVIAASNWENAEPALYAARRWGAPFFYEQRGFWEMSQAADDPDYAASAAFVKAQEMELRIAKEARAVFSLNEAMRTELSARGVPAQKIILVPNGVSEPNRPTPAQQPSITRASLGCTAKYLLGYVGSLSAYEGEDDLLTVLGLLRARNVDVDLLVVGSNAPKGLVTSDHTLPPEDSLSAKAKAVGLAGGVHVTGQVPHDRVASYYALLDAVVMPRKRTPVTELVTPLKPFAAAAFGLPVFMPDMAPLSDIAADIHGSLYPEGDLEALAEMLQDTLEKGGHPAVLNTLPKRVFWRRRVLPMSRAVKAATEAGPGLMQVPAISGMEPATPKSGIGYGIRFDISKLPRVALRRSSGHLPVAVIAGGADDAAHAWPDGTMLTRLTRTNILSELATGTVGRFVVDWPGLHKDPGDWAGLWSIDNMRLNRLVMDACSVALDRGWRVQVIGPMARSRAPLFQTVAQAFEEIGPDCATPSMKGVS
jgi:glycosyltransferase involved in cell wall biosynthesis